MKKKKHITVCQILPPRISAYSPRFSASQKVTRRYTEIHREDAELRGEKTYNLNNFHP